MATLHLCGRATAPTRTLGGGTASATQVRRRSGGLCKRTAGLVKIYLARNSINDAGAAAIAVAVEKNAKLERIGLNANGIGAEGMAAIGRSLETNDTLVKIELRNNNIGTEALALIRKVCAGKPDFELILWGGEQRGPAHPHRVSPRPAVLLHVCRLEAQSINITEQIAV